MGAIDLLRGICPYNYTLALIPRDRMIVLNMPGLRRQTPVMKYL